MMSWPSRENVFSGKGICESRWLFRRALPVMCEALFSCMCLSHSGIWGLLLIFWSNAETMMFLFSQQQRLLRSPPPNTSTSPKLKKMFRGHRQQWQRFKTWDTPLRVVRAPQLPFSLQCCPSHSKQTGMSICKLFRMNLAMVGPLWITLISRAVFYVDNLDILT